MIRMTSRLCQRFLQPSCRSYPVPGEAAHWVASLFKELCPIHLTGNVKLGHLHKIGKMTYPLLVDGTLDAIGIEFFAPVWVRGQSIFYNSYFHDCVSTTGPTNLRKCQAMELIYLSTRLNLENSQIDTIVVDSGTTDTERPRVELHDSSICTIQVLSPCLKGRLLVSPNSHIWKDTRNIEILRNETT